MNRLFASWKKVACAAFFSLTVFAGFSQTTDKFDINFDSFEYTKEFEEKIELFKKSYSFYEKTIEQILADERIKQESAIEEMRSKIYAEEVEGVRLKEIEKLRKEIESELTPIFEQKKSEEVKKIEEQLKLAFEEEFIKNKEVYKQEVRDSLTSEYAEKKNSEVIAEKERLQNKFDEKFKSDYQLYLTEKTKELEEVYEQKKNEEVKKLEEEIRQALEKEFEEKKESYIAGVKAELEPEYEKKKIVDATAMFNQFKDTFIAERKTELKNELAVEFEQRKSSEVSEIEKALKEKYETVFNTKVDEYINKAKLTARSELDSEYEQKQRDYVNAITPELKRQAYIDTKAATERIKTIALYAFIVIILVVCIVSIMIFMANKKTSEEKNKREERQRLEEEKDAKVAEQKAKEQEEAILKLLTIKHFEFLKDTNGDKAACIDYFNEKYPERTLDKVLEYQAYLKAVEMYEHPTMVTEEGN